MALERTQPLNSVSLDRRTLGKSEENLGLDFTEKSDNSSMGRSSVPLCGHAPNLTALTLALTLGDSAFAK